MATDEQIQKWADEAEVGYDVEALKRRGRGRPGRGAEPMQVVAVRLTAEEIAALDGLAAREHMTRSEAIRLALDSFYVSPSSPPETSNEAARTRRRQKETRSIPVRDVHA